MGLTPLSQRCPRVFRNQTALDGHIARHDANALTPAGYPKQRHDTSMWLGECATPLEMPEGFIKASASRDAERSGGGWSYASDNPPRYRIAEIDSTIVKAGPPTSSTYWGKRRAPDGLSSDDDEVDTDSPAESEGESDDGLSAELESGFFDDEDEFGVQELMRGEETESEEASRHYQILSVYYR